MVHVAVEAEQDAGGGGGGAGSLGGERARVWPLPSIHMSSWKPVKSRLQVCACVCLVAAVSYVQANMRQRANSGGDFLSLRRCQGR